MSAEGEPYVTVYNFNFRRPALTIYFSVVRCSLFNGIVREIKTRLLNGASQGESVLR